MSLGWWPKAEMAHFDMNRCHTRTDIDAICRLIDDLLPLGYPVIDVVAYLLQISPRTLQRRLKEEGISYSDLVERCRCQIACKSLKLTRDSIQDIAVTLGYSDPSHFTRAFRRWTGKAPRAWRNQWHSPPPQEVLDQERNERIFPTLIERSRAALKAKDYALCIQSLEEDVAIKELDKHSAKYLKMAKEKS